MPDSCCSRDPVLSSRVLLPWLWGGDWCHPLHILDEEAEIQSSSGEPGFRPRLSRGQPLDVSHRGHAGSCGVMHSPLPGQATGLALPMQGLGHLGARDHGRAEHEQQLLQHLLALQLEHDVEVTVLLVRLHLPRRGWVGLPGQALCGPSIHRWETPTPVPVNLSIPWLWWNTHSPDGKTDDFQGLRGLCPAPLRPQMALRLGESEKDRSSRKLSGERWALGLAWPSLVVCLSPGSFCSLIRCPPPPPTFTHFQFTCTMSCRKEVAWARAVSRLARTSCSLLSCCWSRCPSACRRSSCRFSWSLSFLGPGQDRSASSPS